MSNMSDSIGHVSYSGILRQASDEYTFTQVFNEFARLSRFNYVITLNFNSNIFHKSYLDMYKPPSIPYGFKSLSR